MEQLVNFVIRPPRAYYSAEHDLLDQQFRLKGRLYRREDLEIKNKKGLVLRCSHYAPTGVPEGTLLPCVIYCHGNSGCRADASEAAIILLPSNITVFTLDFSGSGLSEGEHVTLGLNEKEDLRAVVDHLRQYRSVSRIGLWGRSMGAVTSLMYGAEDPSIAGMVLDSPFSNLVDLMMELVDTYKYRLPKFTVKLAIQHMRRIIKKKANFDIMDLDAVQVAKCSFIPVLFGHAEDDDFIQPHHSDLIYKAYAGDKNIIKFEGDHNSPRPQFYFDSITIFFHNVLNPPEVANDRRYYTVMNDYLKGGVQKTASTMKFKDDKSAIPSLGVESTSSTEVAIDQVRQRRPMSRIEVPSNVSHTPDQHESEESTSDLYSWGIDSNDHLRNPPQSVLEPSDGTQYLDFDENFSDIENFPDENFSDVPFCIEDEERMIMEAIMESLKDLKTQNSTKDSQDFDMGTSDSSTSNADKVPNSQPMPSASLSSERTDLSSNNITTPYTTSERISDGHFHPEVLDNPDASSSSSQGGEAVDGTRARLVVQKNPPGHMLDGLVQRFGSFFKGSG